MILCIVEGNCCLTFFFMFQCVCGEIAFYFEAICRKVLIFYLENENWIRSADRYIYIRNKFTFACVKRGFQKYLSFILTSGPIQTRAILASFLHFYAQVFLCKRRATLRDPCLASMQDESATKHVAAWWIELRGYALWRSFEKCILHNRKNEIPLLFVYTFVHDLFGY